MSKERLEEIKEHFAYCMDEGLLFAEQEEKLLEELYEQAERVAELEENYKKILAEWGMVLEEKEDREASFNKFKQQNKQYREVMEGESD